MASKSKERYLRFIKGAGIALFGFSLACAGYLYIIDAPAYAKLMFGAGMGGLILIGIVDRLLAKGKIGYSVWYPPIRYFFSPINRSIPLRWRNLPATRFFFYVFQGIAHAAVVHILAITFRATPECSRLFTFGVFVLFLPIGVGAAILAKIQKDRIARGLKPLPHYL